MMDDHTLTAEAQIVKDAYAALNRGDVDGFVKDFDPEVVRVEPHDVPADGIFRGIDAVKEHVIKGRSTWAEGACEPERLVAAGDKVVVVAHVNVRLNGRTDWVEGRTGDVFTFYNGRVIEFRTFWKPEEAFAWVEAQDRG